MIGWSQLLWLQWTSLFSRIHLHRWKKNRNIYFTNIFSNVFTAWKVSKYGVFFWPIFSCIRTEYGDLLRKSLYSVWIQKNADQKKLRIWTLFTQCLFSAFLNRLLLFYLFSKDFDDFHEFAGKNSKKYREVWKSTCYFIFLFTGCLISK